MEIIFLPHALKRISGRRINKDLVIDTLQNPDQLIHEEDKIIAHKRYFDKAKTKEYLLRVIFEKKGKKKLVISVYRTSKIYKYWRRKE